jgi:hypothetical protein
MNDGYYTGGEPLRIGCELQMLADDSLIEDRRNRSTTISRNDVGMWKFFPEPAFFQPSILPLVRREPGAAGVY